MGLFKRKDKEPDGYCSQCHNPCQEILVDFGIGPYEYWGCKGHDTDKQLVSDCCEAPVVEEYELPEAP